MTRILLLPIFLFCTASLCAQAIRGSVYTSDKTPIAYTNIVLSNSNTNDFVNGTSTDTDGSFYLEVNEKGQYTLEISFLGYESVSMNLDIQETLDLGAITLNNQVNDLSTVELVAKRTYLKKDHDKTTFLIEGNPFLEGKTGIEILKYAPSVWVNPFNGAIRLKGSTSKILIDGHETLMQGEELLSYLNALSNKELKSIEIISNPSSRYDASGTGGIINIITNQSDKKGLAGTLQSKQVFGKFHSHRNALNLNSKLHHKLYLTSTFLYEKNKTLNIEDRKEEILSPKYDGYDYIKQDSTIWSRMFAKLGLQYDISENDVMGFSLGGMETLRDNTQHNDLIIHTKDDVILSNGDYTMDTKTRFFSSGFNYARTLDTLGQNLSIIADYFHSNSDATEIYENAYFDSEGGALVYTEVHPDTHTHIHTDKRKADIPINNHIFAARIDYTKPFPSWKLETGAKYGMVNNTNSTSFQNLIEGVYIEDKVNSYFFKYKEDIWAAYATASFDKIFNTPLDAKIGLRTEYTDGAGNDVDQRISVEKNYLNFFPSVILSRNYNDNNYLSASYSRRINRPSYRSLNPSTLYLTDFATQVGNPNLAPKYTDAFELNYSNASLFNLSLFYDNATGEPREILRKVNDEDIEYQWRNIAHSSKFGATLSFRQKVAKWCEVFINTAVYHKAYRSEFTDLEENIDDQQTTFQGGMSAQFNLPEGINTEVSFQYNGKELFGQFRTGENYAFYLTVSKTFFNKIYVGVNLIDPFDHLRYQFINDQNELLKTYQYRNNFRRAVELTVRYNFETGAKSKAVRLKESNRDLKYRSY